MGALFWIVAGAAGIGGYLAFRKLQELEDDIRDEIGGGQVAAGRDEPEHRRPAMAERPSPVPAPTPVAEGLSELEQRVLAEVNRQPGRLQTELYAQFPELERKQLQELLLRLDRAGRLRRSKEKSTYRIYPA